MAFRILVAEDEQITLNNIVETLAEEGYQVTGAADGTAALRRIEGGAFDLVISDIKMPGRTGLELLEPIREQHPQTDVMLITGYGSISAAVEAMRKGASDYVTKPFDLDELLLKVGKIAQQKTLRREHAALRTFAGLDKKISIIAKSPGMVRILDIVEELKDSDVNILLHRRDRRRQEPDRQGRPLQRPAPADAVSVDELRDLHRGAARERTLRLREGRVHRRRRGQAGARRDRRHRHAVPRRDRASCRPTSRRSCSRSSRRGSSTGSAAPARSSSTCGSSRRPTRTCGR